MSGDDYMDAHLGQSKEAFEDKFMVGSLQTVFEQYVNRLMDEALPVFRHINEINEYCNGTHNVKVMSEKEKEPSLFENFIEYIDRAIDQVHNIRRGLFGEFPDNEEKESGIGYSVRDITSFLEYLSDVRSRLNILENTYRSLEDMITGLVEDEKENTNKTVEPDHWLDTIKSRIGYIQGTLSRIEKSSVNIRESLTKFASAEIIEVE